MTTSYQALGQECATFCIDEEAEFGTPCHVIANSLVAVCDSGSPFCGIIQSVRNGYACVVYRGFVTVSYRGAEPKKGYCRLAAGGGAAVAVSEDDDATYYLVVNVDTTAKTVTFLI